MTVWLLKLSHLIILRETETLCFQLDLVSNVSAVNK